MLGNSFSKAGQRSKYSIHPYDKFDTPLLMLLLMLNCVKSSLEGENCTSTKQVFFILVFLYEINSCA